MQIDKTRHISGCQTVAEDLTCPNTSIKPHKLSNTPKLAERNKKNASTLKEKSFIPYWNEQYKERLSQLMSPIEISTLASNSVSLNEISPVPVGRSWCTIKSRSYQLNVPHETLLPLSLSSASINTDSEVIRTKRALLKPSPTQRVILKSWMNGYRKAFNWTVNRKNQEYVETGKSGTYMASRKIWKHDLYEECPWLESIPAHTVYGAMMDADKAYKLIIGKRSQGLATKLPRCRKRTQRSFYILGNAVTPKGIYPRLAGLMKSAEPLPAKPSDSRILLECGNWYLCYPEKRTVNACDNQTGVIALDPGVRTFLSGFSPRELVKIGSGSFGRIVRLAQYLDDLLSRASKAPSRRKKRMFEAASRMRRKIRRLVDDMHYQAIGWLFKNYQTVVFPEGNFTSAVRRGNRMIGRKSVRALLSYAFATFRDRLIHKARLLGRNVVIVSEAYTSKTANWTGEIVQNLGGRKTITSHGVRFDRDINASLGIYLRALVDHPVACYRNY